MICMKIQAPRPHHPSTPPPAVAGDHRRLTSAVPAAVGRLQPAARCTVTASYWHLHEALYWVVQKVLAVHVPKQVFCQGCLGPIAVVYQGRRTLQQTWLWVQEGIVFSVEQLLRNTSGCSQLLPLQPLQQPLRLLASTMTHSSQ
jgi:hypothetical protein